MGSGVGAGVLAIIRGVRIVGWGARVDGVLETAAVSGGGGSSEDERVVGFRTPGGSVVARASSVAVRDGIS